MDSLKNTTKDPPEYGEVIQVIMKVTQMAIINLALKEAHKEILKVLITRLRGVEVTKILIDLTILTDPMKIEGLLDRVTLEDFLNLYKLTLQQL